MQYRNVFRTSLIVLTMFIASCSDENELVEDVRLDRLPTRVLENMKKDDDGLGFVDHVNHGKLIWPEGEITVAFEKGDDKIFELIERAASEWTDIGGNRKFSFRNEDGSFRRWDRYWGNPDIDIRISFRTGKTWGGYWSYIGAFSKSDKVSPKTPTMNFQNYDKKLRKFLSGNGASAWDNSREKHTVLHEFGHALGLGHEHFHPICQADMHIEKIVQDLMGPPDKWEEPHALFNVKYDKYIDVLFNEGVISTLPTFSETIDQQSVMLYGDFPDDYYKSGANSPCIPQNPIGYAVGLSAGDKQFFRNNYSRNQ